jgi:tRNA(fMet)-specific endonuclease VapC
VSHLLDTNACIALINGDFGKVRTRYMHAVRSGAKLGTSSICAHELWYGVAKSSFIGPNARRLRSFIAHDMEVLNYSSEDAQAAGEIRAELERMGKRIGEYDTLIAGQALARNMVLVTANAREFVRVKGLVVEDWSA